MFAALLPLLIGAVPAIVRELATARNTLENAKTDRERIYAEERIKALEAHRDVLISEARTPWNSITRTAIVAPFVVYIWKLVIYDKISCPWLYGDTCSTDPLSPWLVGLAGMTLGFYFLKSK